MPVSRYLMVRGKPGVLVANPWAPLANPRRYAGKVRDAALDGEPEAIDRYRDCNEVLRSHSDLLSAIDAGHLVLIGKCAAVDAEAAEQSLSKDSE